MKFLNYKLAIFVFIILISYNLEAQVRLKGIITDAESGDLMRRVTVKVKDEKVGCFSNLEGKFDLNLSKGSKILVFRMIGYQELQIPINIERDTNLFVKIQPIKFDTKDVTVYAEDEATRLMRRVIARKLKQREQLENYTYTLYTKFIASTDTLTAGRTDSKADTTIASILESYSKGYYAKPDKYFNEIFQKRQSVNVPPEANFVAFGTNLNAYDDYITILNEEIATPFHPDAIDFYKFEIIGSKKVSSDVFLIKIKVIPLSGQRRLCNGYIYIDEKTLLPQSVELTPNEAVQLPLGASLSYNQDFEVFDSIFALPTRMRIFASLSAQLFWLITPRLDILIETAAYNYQTNQTIDMGVFDRRRTEMTKDADNFDEKYWNDNIVVPLRKEELRAYDQIRRARENPDSLEGTGFIDQIIVPINKALGRFNRKPFTGFEDIFRYNRINGFYLGIGIKDKLFEHNESFVNIGYGFADKKGLINSKFTQYFDENNTFNFDLNLYNRLERRDKPYVIPNRAINFLALFLKNDYGDYYYAQGGEIGLQYEIGQLQFLRRDIFQRPTIFRVFVKSELESNAFKNTNFSLLNWNGTFRDNPPINEGRLSSYGFLMNYNYSQEKRMSNFGFHFESEFSRPNFLNSKFNFNQYYGELRWRTHTLPLWMLDLRLSGGYSEGDLPAQRFFSMETSVSNTAGIGVFRTMRVKEFYGDRFLAINAEHNFGEVVPGVLRIPSIASLGLEFILTGSAGWSYFSDRTRKFNELLYKDITNESNQILNKSTDSNKNKYFGEVGFAVNKLFIFFRFDFTFRLTQSVKPFYIFTISGASF